jgi:hypothetical protein
MLSNECRERWSIGQGRKARFNKCRPGRLFLPRSMKLSSLLGETDPSNVASVLVVSSLTNHGIQRLLKALGQNGNEVGKYGPDLALVTDAPIIAKVRAVRSDDERSSKRFRIVTVLERGSVSDFYPLTLPRAAVRA